MKIINVVLTLFLFVFLVYLALELYNIDKRGFICPIDYEGKPVFIRKDLAGDGDFGASRRGRRVHQGVDLLADIGTPIYAPLSGRVVDAGFQRGYGNYIEIEHRDNLKTIYAHLSEISVKKEQFVRQAQVIGFVGKTGNARRKNILAHLHFEMYKDGEIIDPSVYLE